MESYAYVGQCQGHMDPWFPSTVILFLVLKLIMITYLPWVKPFQHEC